MAPAGVRPIPRRQLPADTLRLARFLLGKVLVHETKAGTIAGRISETEAYLPGDAASHAYRGETPRNAAMFGPRGHAYVYLSYGVHYCFNITSERRGIGAAVLVRALEPLAGIELMRQRRPGMRDHDLARGPGRLSAALGIGITANGLDLLRAGSLWLGEDGMEPAAILTGPRIGITKERERPWRFWLADNRYVSGKRSL